MITVQSIINKIKVKKQIKPEEVTWLENALLEEYELIAIYYHIVLGGKKLQYLKEIITNRFKGINDLVYFYQNQNTFKSVIIKSIIGNKYIEPKIFNILSNHILSETIDRNFIALFLLHVYYFGLSKQNILNFTKSILMSGKIHDYRNLKKLNKYRIVRRYPTGALSEKIALILPALLSHYSKQLRICSPFLIAKSLGFTGGTWDKLSIFPNINYFIHGIEMTNALKKIGSTYCMTENDIAPVDKFLYQMRSLTGTIESLPLIVSSVVSKQLAIPPDILILDIRYGDGAFIQNRKLAITLGKTMIEIIKKIENITCSAKYTNAEQPNGSCIGNFWEVYEAIQLLKGNTENGILNRVASKRQIDLVIKMFLEIVRNLRMKFDLRLMEEELREKFWDGVFYSDFEKIMKLHNVSNHTLKNQFNFKRLNNLQITEIKSRKSGYLKRIEQKEMGNFINYYLGNNKYDLFNPRFIGNRSGIILKFNLNDWIQKDDVLGILLHEREIDEFEVIEMFVIE